MLTHINHKLAPEGMTEKKQCYAMQARYSKKEIKMRMSVQIIITLVHYVCMALFLHSDSITLLFVQHR